MFIDEALELTLREFDKILIPAGEGEKAAHVRGRITSVIDAVRAGRAQKEDTDED